MLLETAEGLDMFYRYDAFLDQLEQGIRPSEAAFRVRETYLDYSALSEVEKSYLRNTFLFYAFMRKNEQFMRTMIMRNPDRVLGFLRFRRDQAMAATEMTDPLMGIPPYTEGRLLYPQFRKLYLETAAAKSMPPQFAGIYNRSLGMVPYSPMLNDSDAFNLWLHLFAIPAKAIDYFIELATGKKPIQDMVEIPDAEKVAQFATQQLNPIFQLGPIAYSGVQPFLGKDIENQKIPANLVQMSRFFFEETLGLDRDLMFSVNSDKPALVNLDFVKLTRSVPDYDDPKTKAGPQAQAAKVYNSHNVKLLGGEELRPAGTVSALMYHTLNNIVFPGMIAQKPGLGGPLLGQMFGRPQQQFVALDQGDLLDWAIERDYFQQQLDTIFELKNVGVTVKSILKEAKDDKLSDDETRKLFYSYILSLKLNGIDHKQHDMMYDVYIKPQAIPSEVHYYKILGWRYQPITDAKIVHREKLNDLLRKLSEMSK